MKQPICRLYNLQRQPRVRSGCGQTHLRRQKGQKMVHPSAYGPTSVYVAFISHQDAGALFSRTHGGIRTR
jgi:hypothetical protein